MAGRKNKRFSLFSLLNYLFFSLVALICLLPYMHIIAKSFSANNAVVAGKVAFWPIGFRLDVYEYVMKDKLFWNAFGNSVFVTLVGTVPIRSPSPVSAAAS